MALNLVYSSFYIYLLINSPLVPIMKAKKYFLLTLNPLFSSTPIKPFDYRCEPPLPSCSIYVGAVREQQQSSSLALLGRFSAFLLSKTTPGNPPQRPPQLLGYRWPSKKSYNRASLYWMDLKDNKSLICQSSVNPLTNSHTRTYLIFSFVNLHCSSIILIMYLTQAAILIIYLTQVAILHG